MLFYLVFFFGLLLNRSQHSQFLHEPSTKLYHHVADTITTTSLFEDTNVLNLTLAGEIKKLVNDRSDFAKQHPLLLKYKDVDSTIHVLPIRAKTRGNFRRKLGNCTYPPIMLYFTPGDSLASSIFAGQKKLKLVVPCRSNEHIIKEWLAYQLYNKLTPESFRARLVNIHVEDTKKSKQSEVIYGILLEDEDDMARRNSGFSVSKEKLQPTEMDSTSFFRMALFQYMIGNTDWSIQFMQNIKFIVSDTNNIKAPVTVPYDFDMSGWVDAPYAKPAEALNLASVKTRRFRGYCVSDISAYTTVINYFISKKNEMYAVLDSTKLLSDKTLKAQRDYLDSFYKLLEDPVKLKKDLLYPCDKNGTGNVVISGLQANMEEEE